MSHIRRRFIINITRYITIINIDSNNNADNVPG